VPGAPFDLVFARLLLIHMTDPVAAVRRLAALVRPGGTLVLMDYDLSRMACRPDHPAVARGLRIIADCFTRSGKDADCGLKLASYIADAGLPRPPPGYRRHLLRAGLRRRGDGPRRSGQHDSCGTGARHRRSR
jgi:hypothetical protein